MTFECEDCIGVKEHGCYCAAMGASQPGGPLPEDDEPFPGLAPCPVCFESSGYVWEHGNDWDSGPWSHQTNIQCSHCHGTGSVEAEPITMDDLEEMAAQEKNNG